MKRLSVSFEKCYGISKLKHDFDFSEYHAHLVYAPNGVMKSSFAKVFDAYQNGKETEIRDRIFINNDTKHEIRVDGDKLDSKEIFVIKPFEDSFHSQNISEILLKEDYKKEYEKIVSDLKISKRDFLSQIMGYFKYIKKSGDELDGADMTKINYVSKPEDVEMLFVDLFAEKKYNSDLDFYEVILDLDKKIKEKKDIGSFSQIKYGVIFNEKTTGKGGFLSESDYRSLLGKYVERYKKLIEGSKYFNLSFTHTSAEKVVTQMEDAHYFDTKSKTGESATQNGFQLYNKQSDGRDPKEKEELIEEINNLKKELTKDPEFSTHLAAIDKALDGTKSTKVTKKFKEYILDEEFDPNFLLLLGRGDLSFSQKELIYSYLVASGDSFSTFFKKTNEAYKAIEDLVKKVREDETTIWHKAVSEFHNRFRVPFVVSISDDEKDKVLLNGHKLQSLEYWFCQVCGADANRICKHSREGLVKVNETKLTSEKEDSILSQGERRAFYLLNIIFEIKYRKENKIPTLFIIDDIADSFDYQNKYAIAEYLKEISEESFFYSIILTHNFDFFRTLKNRLEIKSQSEEGEWFYIAEKTEDEISLVPQNNKNIIEPFKNWQEKLKNCTLNDAKYIYAVILMMRNIIDYSGIFKEKWEYLNDLLHGRGDKFEEITMGELENILKEIGLKNISLDVSIRDEKYFELLKKIVSELVKCDSLSLEDKIVISLCIRLTTEKYLRNKGYKGNLREMLVCAEKDSLGEIEQLKRVNLITPEHIHINSFMYEPLIDIDKNQITNLFEIVGNIIRK